MNSAVKLHLPGYGRAIFGMVILLLAFLTLSDIFLLRNVRREYLENFQNHTVYELEEAAAFMVEPLLKNEFAYINQFIEKWSETHKDVIRFEAVTPKGYTLSSFQRDAPSDFLISMEKKVTYADQHMLTLVMTKDYSEIERMLDKTKYILLGSSIVIVMLLGGGLWILFRRLAISPLEQEIAMRMDAEKELEDANTYLEEKVLQRTKELSDRNQELLQEIQQRETAENLLADEKERLAVTLRSIGDGVITTDISGGVVLMNKVAESLTGWTQAEANGKPLHEVFNIINEQTGKPCESPFDKVMQSGQIVGLANHTALISRDGRERIIADSGAPIRDRNSAIVGVVLVFRDITEQQRTEQEMLKIRKLESVGLLAGGIAHDFNNILAAILGNINLGLFDRTLSDKTRRLLSDAEKACLRAKDLTHQLLTFAKGGEPVKETSSLVDIIKDSANFVLHGDKVSCRFDIPPDLWPANVDKGQISQVIQNIVLNAAHAMPQGGAVTIRCENVSVTDKDSFHLLQKGKYVKIVIADTGIGIPAKVIDRIFDPYFSTKQEGSGLGLATSQSIVNRHGGHIMVQSKQGEGTVFTLYLPASDKLIQPEQNTEISGDISAPAKILVMDDEDIVRDIAGKMIAQLGHEVFFAEHGEKAISMYREAMAADSSFDLVIMDLTIQGGMGGKDAVREIRALDPGARVIVSSGYSNDAIMSNCREYGFRAAIVKPYQVQELSRVLRQVLEEDDLDDNQVSSPNP
ncbi:MAG: ATP-binding protein [Desulfobulbaceae bacterium]|nr:ATP-binding protein [Desulfobulbaceae bacterium]